MQVRRVYRLLAALTLCAVVCSVAGAQTEVKRILIVGDSWASSIATTHHDPIPPGFGSLDKVLQVNRLGGYKSEGGPTAWGGRKASDWVKPQNMALITQQLENNPTIDIVHLIIGGNDYLSRFAQGTNVWSLTPEQRDEIWNGIKANVQKIVDHCLSIRPDIRVVISDYDYLNASQAEPAYGFNFGGATPEQLNATFMELGRKKMEIAQSTPRCYYISHWGRLHHHYGYPEADLPLPGDPPSCDPYAGGDPKSPMPPGASVGDGIHPTDEAHRYMLQRCVDVFYREWLISGGAQPDSDGDGLKDGDELRDLDNVAEGVQNPFDPAVADSTGDDRSNEPDGKPDGQNDYDGDGVPNDHEFSVGHNPNLEASGKAAVAVLVAGIAAAGLYLVRRFAAA